MTRSTFESPKKHAASNARYFRRLRRENDRFRKDLRTLIRTAYKRHYLTAGMLAQALSELSTGLDVWPIIKDIALKMNRWEGTDRDREAYLMKFSKETNADHRGK